MTGQLIRSTGALLQRTAPKVAPSVRASNITTVAAAATINVTIPSGAVVGDLALFFVCSRELSYVTAPNGYSLECQTHDGDGPEPRLTIFSRRVVTGDPGSSVAFSISVADAAVASCVVVRDTSGFSVAPKLFVCETGDHTDSTTYRAPTVWAGPEDLILGVTGQYPLLAYGKANALLTVAPAGTTILQTDANTPNALVLHRGMGVFASGYHAPQWEQIGWPNACYFSAITMALAPVDPHWAGVERGPSSLEGKRVYHYGTSSGGFIRHPSGTGSNGFNTNEPWPKRIADALGSGGMDHNNMCMPGAKAADICAMAYGTKVVPTRTVPNDFFVKNQALTVTALPDRKNAVYLIDQIGNDVISMGTSEQSMAGVQNSVDSLFRLLRSDTVTNAGDSSCTYSGTWSTLASDGLQGGSARLTTVNGSQVSVAVSGVTAVDLVICVEDNAADSTIGASFDVLVDGVLYASGVTHNQMKATAGATYANYKRTQRVLTVEGLSTSAHAIVLRHTGTAGSRLVFNAWMTRNSNPPWIVANLLPQMPAGTYAAYGFTAAQADQYAALMQTIANQFSDGKVVLYNASEAGYWDPSKVFAPDGVHQNEIGESHYAHEILRMLRERVPSPPADPPPPPRPSEVVQFTTAGASSWTCPSHGDQWHQRRHSDRPRD